jgi:hypothetical protein
VETFHHDKLLFVYFVLGLSDLLIENLGQLHCLKGMVEGCDSLSKSRLDRLVVHCDQTRFRIERDKTIAEAESYTTHRLLPLRSIGSILRGSKSLLRIG